jgi:endoribonuclease Dicer
MTDLRSALVNNSFFGCLSVKFNLHKYLKVMSYDLFRAIDVFVKRYGDNKGQIVFGSFLLLTQEKEGEEVEEVEVPKALGDIFESLAGAVYLDSGYSLDTVWRVFYRLMKPELDHFAENVPKSAIRQLYEQMSGQTITFGEAKTVGRRKVKVTLTIGNEEFSGIGRNRRWAKSAAAKRALKEYNTSNCNQ